MLAIPRSIAVGAAAVALLSASGVASAAPLRRAQGILTGYSYVESRVSLPAGQEAQGFAVCPTVDYPVGGGAYQTNAGLSEILAESAPSDATGQAGLGWTAMFSNQGSSSTTGVVVAICASASSVPGYTVVQGYRLQVPPNEQLQSTVTCPSGTVALGGGWWGAILPFDGAAASAPYGTNGWRAWLTAGPGGGAGAAFAECAKEPTGWAQVSSTYEVNPAHTATDVDVICPAGTSVLSGGAFNSSYSPLVNIAVTSPLSNLGGWHTTEDNNSGASESVDAWATCAEV